MKLFCFGSKDNGKVLCWTLKQNMNYAYYNNFRVVQRKYVANNIDRSSQHKIKRSNTHVDTLIVSISPGTAQRTSFVF